MNAVRIASITALTASLPVVVWASGMLAIGGIFEASARGILSDALRALFVVIAVAAVIFGVHAGLRWNWRQSGSAQIVFLTAPYPFFCIAWLAGAAPLQAVLKGCLLMAIGSALVPAMAKGFARVLPGPPFESVTVGILQLAAAGSVFATRDIWLEWIGI